MSTFIRYRFVFVWGMTFSSIRRYLISHLQPHLDATKSFIIRIVGTFSLFKMYRRWGLYSIGTHWVVTSVVYSFDSSSLAELFQNEIRNQKTTPYFKIIGYPKYENPLNFYLPKKSFKARMIAHINFSPFGMARSIFTVTRSKTGFNIQNCGM